MGCDFCATGRLGLTRHLEPWEIVAQFLAVRDEAPGIVTGAVFQGQGEPLHNYATVMRAAEILVASVRRAHRREGDHHLHRRPRSGHPSLCARASSVSG